MTKPMFALATAALWAAILPAQASTLIGSQVTVAAYYPDLSTPVSYSRTQTAGPGIEFPSGSIQALPSIGGGYIIGENIDVGAETITFTYTQDAQSASAAFNGWVLNFDAASPTILGVSLDPSSTFSNVGLTFGPHQITDNESGLYVTTDSRIVLDVTLASSANPTPEPQTWALMLSGLGLTAWGLKRRGTKTLTGSASV